MTSRDQLPRVVIWGASGHALVVVDILRLMGVFELVGLLDDVAPERRGELVDGLPVLGGREQLPELYVAGVRHLIIGFGNCRARLRLGRAAHAQGFTLATAIHPHAVVARNATVGPGSMVAAGAVINPLARVGANVIVNTGASVDHESVVEGGAHICPGVRLAGRVVVGEAAWVGIGSTVRDGVHIGREALIGAGSVVLHDIPDYAVAYGCPARVVRLQPPTEK